LLGEVNGKRVLEIGCGGGQNSIALSRWGARVVGVDSSENQITFARDLARREGVEASFIVGNHLDLLRWDKDSYDIAISCFCLEYIEDLDSFLSAIRNVLREEGILVVCDLHPLVSGADIVGISMGSYIESVDYFRSRAVPFKWRFSDGTTTDFIRYHRTFADLFSSLQNGDFIIEDIREPRMFIEPCGEKKVPYRDLTLGPEREVWNKLPYTLIIKSRLSYKRR